MQAKTVSYTNEPDETPASGIQLVSETLAVAFSECSRRNSLDDVDRRGSVASSQRGGKSLFRKFVKENSTSVWRPELVKSLSTVRFGGYLQEPPTLLLQGDSTNLQHVRDAWSNHLLRPPAGYHIDFVGDVTRIGTRPLTRERFVPICDAICISIGNVTSRNEMATQGNILSEIERSFPDVDSPTRELLHETLGKLIRNRKVFCTGSGYHLVTTRTYSGKVAKEDGEEGSKTKGIQSHGCEACQKNRQLELEDQMKERRVGIESRENSDPLSNSTIDGDTLHGSVASSNMQERNVPKNDNSPRPSPKKSVERDRRSSIVGKVADKLFRRRRKSSSDGRTSDLSSSRKEIDRNSQVRELNGVEARRLGYDTSVHEHSYSSRQSSRGSRSTSESPVKRSYFAGRKSREKQESMSPKRTELRISKSFKHNIRISSPEQKVPEIIPDTHRSRRSEVRRSHSERRPVKPYNPESLSEKQQAKPDITQPESGNNRFPKLRDVAVSCNLEVEDEDARGTNRYRMTSPTGSMTSSIKHAEGKLHKRSKSLRLPRNCCTHEYETPSSEVLTPEPIKRYPPPEYNSIQESETSRNITYDSLQRSTEERRMRRSTSSVSTGKDYSYLHACHFAPSVRVGSVIADHLEELERRRVFWGCRSSHEMSPSPSTVSSRLSRGSNEASPKLEQTLHDHSVTPSHPQNTPEIEDKEDEQSPETIDPETQAALHVAKRLAKLDIKMTRQEWKDYFAEKILPPQVEHALREADEKEHETQLGSMPTCFENTSGSVETVIDVHQRENSRSRRSRTSESSNRSSVTSEKRGNHRNLSESNNPSYNVGSDEYGSLRSAESPRLNDSNNSRGKEGVVDRAEHKEVYRCPDFNRDEEYEPQVFYTCDHGHRHLPYCEQHRQLATIDSASLTEDSGFHSARERSSLSSWNTQKKPRGTFV